MGFDTDQAQSRLSELSGGQQNLALLARSILLEPELLLMDEPGNHMDVMALAYLERFLLSGPGIPFLMISHDRELLDNCCNRTIFLRDTRLYSFDLPFGTASQALADHDAQAAKSRQAEEKEIKRLQSSAKRLAQWGKTYDNEDLARKAKSMQKRVDKLKLEQTETCQGSTLELHMKMDALRSRSLLTIENLPITIDGRKQELLRIEFQHIRPGDRIALLGRNGVGKSTTINRLVEAVGTLDRHARFNPNVSLGYYDQQLENFNADSSRFDWLRDRSNALDDQIKQVLLQHGINYADFDQSVNKLSCGECARLMFMLFHLNKPNLLILDEPTNHIDIHGRQQLEQQLIESRATLLITSHDRQFIEQVATRWWWINDGKLIELNNIEEFYTVVKHDSLPETTPAKSVQQCSDATSIEGMNEEEKLARIDELETLLREDKARKAKFQKPARQKSWEQELSKLWKAFE